MRYTRKVSPIERYSLVLNKICPYNVVAVVEGDGDLSVERLRAAVKLAAVANPGMRVRLRSFLGFSKWVDSGIDPQVYEPDMAQWDARSDAGADYLETGFDPLAGDPVCDLLFLRGSPVRIVFRAAHAAIDGRGVKHWMQEVFRALRDEPLIGAPSTEREIDIMEKYQHEIPDAVKPKKNAVSPASLPVVSPSQCKNPNLRYLWRSISISGDSGNLLPKSATFLAAYARRHAKGHVSFTIPVDLRTTRRPLLSTGNLTGYLNIIVNEGDAPRVVMKQINQKLRDHFDCLIPSIVRLLPWIPISKLFSGAKKGLERSLYDVTPNSPTGGLVSMGLFRLGEFSCPGFVARTVIGIPGFAGKLNVVLINQQTHTTVTFAAPEAYNADGQLDEFVAAFSRHFDGKEVQPELAGMHA